MRTKSQNDTIAEKEMENKICLVEIIRTEKKRMNNSRRQRNEKMPINDNGHNFYECNKTENENENSNI